MNPDFAMPNDLDESGKKVYQIIKTFLQDFKDLETGGCQSFYSPKEWISKGESYGANAKLIICYDGSDLRSYFNMDACYDIHCMLVEALGEMPKRNPYHSYEALQEALRKEGFHFEECTGWYAAVYQDAQPSIYRG